MLYVKQSVHEPRKLYHTQYYENDVLNLNTKKRPLIKRSLISVVPYEKIKKIRNRVIINIAVTRHNSRYQQTTQLRIVYTT
jgi:sporulation protein YlmC with PRC-barrel domain